MKQLYILLLTLSLMTTCSVAKSSKIQIKTQHTHDIYTIKKGDTLYKLALKNRTTVKKIKRLNKISRSRRVKIGQKILLIADSNIVTNNRIKQSQSVKKNLRIERELSQIKHMIRTAYFSEKTTKISQQALSNQVTPSNSVVKLTVAKKHLGKRYVWGATGTKTFDCSGFTRYVCNKSGTSLPRTSINQK